MMVDVADEATGTGSRIKYLRDQYCYLYFRYCYSVNIHFNISRGKLGICEG